MERIEKLKSFLQENNNDSFVCHALALEYIKIGDDGQAQPLFESIIRREPGYIGTYYHLAKLHERNGQKEEAVHIYKRGMAESKKANDMHTYNELQAALEDLEDL